jgi:hypothetical protein
VTDTALSPEELRHQALDALGPYADERAREVLQGAELRVDRDVTGWESSAGPVQGHRVTLAVDASTLARLRTTPALEDALHAAVATAIAGARTGDALVALELRWAREGTHASAHGYRDRPPDPPQTLQEALASYLDVLAEAALARLVEDARITVVAEDTVSLAAAPDRLRAFRSAGAAATAALTAAVRDLLGAPGARVVVES